MMASVATRDGSFLAMLILIASTAWSAEKSPADAEHLLFLADQGLTVIRLRIDIDGKPHKEVCRSFLQTICTEADRDQDGMVSAEEYDAGLATHPILQERQARQARRPNATPDRPDFGSTGKLSSAAVASYLLRTVWLPLTLDFAGPQLRRLSDTGELLDRPRTDEQLFERLDTDGNRKLTSRELERAVTVLAKLDFDEDETISLDELRMQSPANVVANPNRSARQSDSHLSQLSADRIDAAYVRRILALYDGEAKGSVKDLRVDRTEVGLPEHLFSPADADQDGYWDFDELWRFLEQPVASAEIAIHLRNDAASTAAEMTILDDGAIRTSSQQSGWLNFAVHGVRFQWFLPAGVPPVQDLSAQMAAQFQALDADKNDYLTPAEFDRGNEEEPSPAFRSIDVDGDRMITAAEFRAYSQLLLSMTAAQQAQLVLRVENLERTLFGPLDANGDGRLSLRELAGLKDRLPEWDADGDGKLVETEIPQQYRLILSRSGGNALVPRGIDFDFNSSENSNANSKVVSAGPLWFRKMDRNRDGEVSAREFLGTAERFQVIDTNADGAIDAAEAGTVK